MRTKRLKSLLTSIISVCLLASLFPAVALADQGDNLWISDSKWGQLIDNSGNAIYAKGIEMIIPVTITSAQGTILVTTPGIGETNDELSMPQLNPTTHTYENVVYVDQVSAPTDGSVYNYTFGIDPQEVAKGETLYVKVGGTSVPAGDNQKATTVYLGNNMPGEITNYSAANVDGDLVITTPSAVWSNPKVYITVAEGDLIKEVSVDITITDTSINVPNGSLRAAFAELSSGTITITSLKIMDSVIEDITLPDQNITFALLAGAPAVFADDVANVILGLDLATMEYAISTDGGVSYGEYTADAAPFLGGSKMVKVRMKAVESNHPGADALLTYTTNFGDINADGLIDISDIIMVAEIAVGYHGYTPEQIARANVSNEVDLTVDIADVILILERTASGTTSFPVELLQ